MSYDLHFYRLPTGSTPQQAHEEEVDDPMDKEASWTHRLQLSSHECESVITAIQSACPGLELTHIPNWSITQLSTGEHAGNHFQWSISSTGASLSWPYTKNDEQLQQLLERIRPAVDALLAKGLRAYDPQLGRELNPATDWATIPGFYAQTNQMMADAIGTPADDATPSTSTRPTRTATTPKPWWRFW